MPSKPPIAPPKNMARINVEFGILLLFLIAFNLSTPKSIKVRILIYNIYFSLTYTTLLSPFRHGYFVFSFDNTTHLKKLD